MNRSSANLIRGLSLLAILVVWWIISLFFPPSFIPGPEIVLKKVAALLFTGEFLFHMYKTLLRVILGFLWAFVIGSLIGMVMGFSRLAEHFFEVEVLVGLTIPGLAWAIISLMWFGIRDFSAIFSIFIIILPMIAVNMWEGTKALDRELIEMGHAFKASRKMVIRHVVIPQLVPYLFAATRFGFALAWKVVVVAEMLGLSNGVGFMINHSFGLFDMEGVLAWTLSFTLVMILLEFGIVKLIEKRATKWRPAVTLM
ncbi:MAG: ABC transporter permease [Candidatus Tectomicrobia bacterium]|uniref:ABC transporter permease n=1 Tax=Tectimicrobiota bacterium TaxID=2528274 RepID=A0A932GMH9_UNCTE|nr:ABC transporter permease [Candidatus Tectomicrobia bacterium]